MHTGLLVYPNIRRLFENLHGRESYIQRVSNSARVTEPECYQTWNTTHATPKWKWLLFVFCCSDTPPSQATSGTLQFTWCPSLLQWTAGLNPVQGKDVDSFRVLLCCCPVQAKLSYEPIPWQIRSLTNPTSKRSYIRSGQQALKWSTWRIRIKILIFVLCSFRSHRNLTSNIYTLFFISLLHVRNNSTRRVRKVEIHHV